MPRLHGPAEVAEALGCSTWWVKDRARRRLIPHTRVGRAYRFTAEHLAEIIRLQETGPTNVAPSAPPARTPAPRPAARRREEPAVTPIPRLRARPPRRARQSNYDTAA
ncbi:helix-turn-helix domain-containing protein [Streptomyces sp. NBC_01304]|uniref:helix-turn-helix domain-containing protein n=1 Tax=Streptomyces sp. NBC_01304 TaxID=2903818 RepID=UPI002E10248C|nr:helix-turn-helix domain-containing protein [Streptomyces sp. NBC_01304]